MPSHGRGRFGRKPGGEYISGHLGIILLLFLGLIVFFARGSWGDGNSIDFPAPGRGKDDLLASIPHILLKQGIPGLQRMAAPDFSSRFFIVTMAGLLTGIYLDHPASLLAGSFSGLVAVPVPAGGDAAVTTDVLPARGVTGELQGGGNENEITSTVTTFPPHVKPKILIYHSHITETYYPTAGEYFSRNLNVTVARLGRILAESLERDYHIPVMHCTLIFDLPRRTAYQKARPEISKLLEENPQINMAVDLHRDGILRKFTTSTVNGKETGNLLIVIGSGHEHWESNFSTALLLQQELEKIDAGISRGILCQGFTYNQDLHERAMIVEVGGHQNTLEESIAAIPILAEALSRTYTDQFGK
jgi:stage II sporulation protein P